MEIRLSSSSENFSKDFFDDSKPVILMNPESLKFAVESKIADYIDKDDPKNVYLKDLWEDKKICCNYMQCRRKQYKIGIFNKNGIDLLNLAISKGWYHRHFGFFKKYNVYFFFAAKEHQKYGKWGWESIWGLFEFTGIKPIDKKDDFVLPEIDKTFDELLEEAAAIQKKAERAEKTPPVWNKWYKNLNFGEYTFNSNVQTTIPDTLWNRKKSYNKHDFQLIKDGSSFPSNIPDKLDLSSIEPLIPGDPFTRNPILKIIKFLEKFSNSKLTKRLSEHKEYKQISSQFRELILEHGIFSGIWFHKIFVIFLTKNLYKIDIDLKEIQNLLNDTYQYEDELNFEQNKEDKDLLFKNLSGHFFWQELLLTYKDKTISKKLKKWVEFQSKTRECSRDSCNNTYSPITIDPKAYYLTNGNKLLCYRCVEERPKLQDQSVENIKRLVSKLVDTLGFIPPQSFLPYDRFITTRIDHNTQLKIIDIFQEMGTFDSIIWLMEKPWYNILVDFGLLEINKSYLHKKGDSRGFGIRCKAKDGHICNSLDEMYIDDYLHENNINHTKEPKYPFHKKLNTNKNKRADWKINNYYVEYFGLTGIDSYDEKTAEKFKLAEETGIKLISIFPENLGNLSELTFK